MANEAEPVFETIASKDTELHAMRVILQAIDKVPELGARRRVLDYVRERALPAPAPAPLPAPASAGFVSPPAEFEFRRGIGREVMNNEP